MDTLRDIWASLVAGVQERTTNPLTFSFIASWCLWNFKFFFILAGDGTTAERLNAVDALYPVAWSTYVGHAFGAPLASALVYVFVYPSISAFVIESYRSKQVAIANTVKALEGNRLLTVEETTRLTRDHESERSAWQEREARLLQQLKLTREALAASEKEVFELANAEVAAKTETPPLIAKVSPEEAPPINLPSRKATASSGAELFSGPVNPVGSGLTDAGRDILFALSDSPRGLDSGQLAKEIENIHSVVVVNLDELLGKGLVRKRSDGDWELTPAGHTLVVKLFGPKEA